MKQKTQGYRWLFYLIGLLVLALGIILNTKSGLGVSPIISVSYCVSVILNLNFGNMTLILYSGFIVIEIILHALKDRKTLKIMVVKDVLQFPLSLVFTRFMNLFSAMIPAYDTPGVSGFYASVVGRLVTLMLAIILTGIGAAMSLNMRLIPNPGDGIVQAISDTIGKSVGFTKNCFDLTSIVITIVLSLIVTGHVIGIGLGTVLAMVGVGRVIAVFNHFIKVRMDLLAGIVRET